MPPRSKVCTICSNRSSSAGTSPHPPTHPPTHLSFQPIHPTPSIQQSSFTHPPTRPPAHPPTHPPTQKQHQRGCRKVSPSQRRDHRRGFSHPPSAQVLHGHLRQVRNPPTHPPIYTHLSPHPPTQSQPTAPHSNRLVLLYLPINRQQLNHLPTHPSSETPNSSSRRASPPWPRLS